MARLIDADKLEKDLMDMAHNELMPDYFRQMCMSMAERVSKEPTIEIEPVRYGRWVYDNKAGFWKCSLCNRAAISSGYGQELSEHCPRCGARMVGG